MTLTSSSSKHLWNLFEVASPPSYGRGPKLQGSAWFWACIVQIKDHKLVQNDCLDHLHQYYLDSIAQYLPDMELVINKDDRPIIYKN